MIKPRNVCHIEHLTSGSNAMLNNCQATYNENTIHCFLKTNIRKSLG